MPVQRCYPPLTLRVRFSPKRLMASAPALTLRHIFDITESTGVQHSDRTSHQAARTPDARPEGDSGWGPTRSFPIRKPPGEVTRLKRGGYNLKDQVGWSQDIYDMVKEYLNELVEEHLDLDKCLSKQPRDNVYRTYQKAIERFPNLQRYEDDWVTAAFIGERLRNVSARRRKERESAGRSGRGKGRGKGKGKKDGDGPTPSSEDPNGNTAASTSGNRE
ncbi:hypothetical protein BD410DRAFT_802360 [Rickenella mellea]|uniref:Uncharacterized protein n=1 Tax=Rickenella mellea TaxID=50990 RepID=A0A4Y7QA04_9AGAM|nr:hypothetical protein BD410DRAFT_802360 [Rickenella mellea]